MILLCLFKIVARISIIPLQHRWELPCPSSPSIKASNGTPENLHPNLTANLTVSTSNVNNLVSFGPFGTPFKSQFSHLSTKLKSSRTASSPHKLTGYHTALHCSSLYSASVLPTVRLPKSSTSQAIEMLLYRTAELSIGRPSKPQGFRLAHSR